MWHWTALLTPSDSYAGQIHAAHCHRALQHVHLLEPWKQLYRHAIQAVFCLLDIYHRSSTGAAIAAPISPFAQPLRISRGQFKDILVEGICNQRNTSRTSLLDGRWHNLLQLLVSITMQLLILTYQDPGTGVSTSHETPSNPATRGCC